MDLYWGINMKINRNNFKRAAQDIVLEPLLGINMKINRKNFKRAAQDTVLEPLLGINMKINRTLKELPRTLCLNLYWV